MPPRLPRPPKQSFTWGEFGKDLYEELLTSTFIFCVIAKCIGLKIEVNNPKSFAELHQRTNSQHNSSGKGKDSGEGDTEHQDMRPTTSASSLGMLSAAGRLDHSIIYLLAYTPLVARWHHRSRNQPPA